MRPACGRSSSARRRRSPQIPSTPLALRHSSMANTKRPKHQKRSGTVRSSRATIGDPASRDAARAAADLSAKTHGTEELAAAIPFNPNKAHEYDPAAAIAPPAGLPAAPEDPIVGASTVTER